MTGQDVGTHGEPSDEPKGRNPWILAAVAIAVVIVAVGLVLVFRRGEAHQPPPASAAPASEPTSARSVTATPPPPTTAVELPVSGGSYENEGWAHPHVGVTTPSGDMTCEVVDEVPVPEIQVPVSELVDWVYCMVDFSAPPKLRDGRPAVAVLVRADGDWEWADWGMAPPGDVITLAYGATYRAVGWTIEPTREGLTFTNDATGHGMHVSVEGVEAF